MKNVCLMVGVVAMMLALIVGCGGLPATPKAFAPDQSLVTVPINQASTASAKAEAHIHSAENAVQAVVEVAPPAEKPLLKIASDEHAAAVKTITTELNPQLEKAMTDKAKADADAIKATKDRDAAIAKWSADYSSLEGKWYVVWGRRIEAFIWWAVAIWVGLGIASVLLGLGNPLGWLTTASNAILHLIPLANVFAWFRSLGQWIFDRIQLGHTAVKAGAIPPRLVHSRLNGFANGAAVSATSK